MPLFYLCAAFLAGVLAAGRLAWPAWAWLAAALACLVPAAGVLLARRRRPLRGPAGLLRLLDWLHLHPAAVPAPVLRLLPFLVLSSFCAGAARAAAWQPLLDEPGFIARYAGDGVRYTVVGVLDRPPDERDRVTYLRVDAVELRPADGFRHLPVRGMLLARIDPGGDWRYGDRVTVTGSLQIPPEDEDFSYRDYLARQGIYAYMPFAEAAVLESGHGSPLLAAVYAFKERAWQTLHRLFPEPEASLLSGILLGLDGGLSPDLQEDFRATGASHIIAISGFNISIIAAIFTSLFGRWFGRGPGTLAAIAAVAVYTVLVGAEAAVVRAAIMGVMAIALRQAGRSTAGMSSLMAAAAAMTFANPAVPGDVGFQLSFAATLGLVLYAGPLADGVARLASRYLCISTVRRVMPFVSDAFLLTLAAQITTLPVILYHFGRLSLTAFVVNPLILPVQPAVMVLGGLATLLGMAWLVPGQLMAAAAFPFTAYTIRIVELFAQVPGGVLAGGQVSAGLALAALVGPAVHRAAVRARPGYSRWRGPLLLVCAAAAVWAWRGLLAAGNGELRITLLDVGMGEAILIQTPEDRWVLINGGPSGVRLADQFGRRVPLSQRELDWLVVAGASDDQIGALPRLLEQVTPQQVLLAAPQNLSLNARTLQNIMNSTGVPVWEAEPGQSLDLGRGAALDVLAIGPRGAVLLLRWDRFRLLLPLGQDFESLSAPVEPVTGLLLAESGFAPLNPPEWIAAAQPQFILLSVEAGNRAGLPSPETLDSLDGIPLLRTDRDGWVEIVTDGEEVWISTSGN